jgi:acyl-CoA thioesterase-1
LPQKRILQNLFLLKPLLRKKQKMSLSKLSLSLIFSLITSFALLSACGSSTDEKQTETKAADSTLVSTAEKTILFFGNSLTAGYGIDPEDAFAGLVQERLDSLGKEYRVINGGLSGETTAGGLSRLDWFLEEDPTIFILELGGNDGLRGILPSESKRNLLAIIDKVRAKYPATKIILAGMQIPPNMGQDYTEEFKAIYPAVAAEKNVTLIPFLLEGVAGNPDLNLPDGIHPTEEGHKIVFETVWKTLEKLLE